MGVEVKEFVNCNNPSTLEAMKFDQDELVSCFEVEMLQYEYNLFIQYEKSSKYLKSSNAKEDFNHTRSEIRNSTNKT